MISARLVTRQERGIYEEGGVVRQSTNCGRNIGGWTLASSCVGSMLLGPPGRQMLSFSKPSSMKRFRMLRRSTRRYEDFWMSLRPLHA